MARSAPGTTLSPTASARHRSRNSLAGFTLLELLVAAAVLVMLVIIIAQLVQSGNLLIAGSRRHLSADEQARAVFSRFDQDLARMPQRTDLSAVLSSSNNAIFFFSEAPGFYGSPSATADHNTLSLVGYRVNTNAQLDRLGKGLSWTNLPSLTYATNAPAATSTPLASSTIPGAWAPVIGTAPAYGDGIDSDYHLLADGVFRIFYCFQAPSGGFSLSVATNALQPQFQNVAAIVLTLAVLDGDSRKTVSDVSKLAAALPDPTAAIVASGTLPAQLWQDAVDNVTQFSTAAGIPATTASRVRIYQRTFALGPR